MAEQKPQVIGNCLWCHERLFMTIPHRCKEMDELPSKSEEHVMTTEQNTKQDSEWRKILHKSLYKAGFKILEPKHPLYVVVVEEVIRSLLASQRHQLKEQVLEAIGSEEKSPEYKPILDEWGNEIILRGHVEDAIAHRWWVMGRKKLIEEQCQRIEAVFEGKKHE